MFVFVEPQSFLYFTDIIPGIAWSRSSPLAPGPPEFRNHLADYLTLVPNSAFLRKWKGTSGKNSDIISLANGILIIIH